ncbi:uncharacterized protein BT62DRAFT_698797 [Guyanagaster necrorhizus]|uniref:Uncharacterized protein n=1 Tax=Guyanagaster necrorhizus TaxID=856835 RepID=A0A9P8ALB4_9AGAR|nr:uncharacterized protein BT62DRAFT_698797 [Guyanagaster necrorhizus MCA 3950]KAG7439549.1 hypothetical protein BT62DRAFT_698797 [Guyanagaster necrorhizus MCA 3950]
MTSNSQDDTQAPSPTPRSDAQTEEPTSAIPTESHSKDPTEDAISAFLASPTTRSYLWHSPSYTESPSLTPTLQDAASSIYILSSSSSTVQMPNSTNPIRVGPGLVIILTSVSLAKQQHDLITPTTPSATSDLSSPVSVGPSHTATPQTSPKDYSLPRHQLIVLVIGFFSFLGLILLVYFVESRNAFKNG